MLALLAIVQPGGPDPRIGTWTLASAQASLNPPNKLTVTALQDSVHVVMSGETFLDFTAKSDAHDTAVPNNPVFDQVALRRINKRQAVVTEKKAGAVVATVREKLSNDGSELTITTASAGKADKITVWDRTGGAKVARDLLAGEWTEDLGKSLMRQGMPLKIEPDGNGGVHFSGDFSYTAHLDGKPYDLQNAPFDTVTLQLIDPHTVETIYRRGDQVAQKNRWVVSADGQQMTLTASGSLESNQSMTEKLVFKKQ